MTSRLRVVVMLCCLAAFACRHQSAPVEPLAGMSAGLPPEQVLPDRLPDLLSQIPPAPFQPSHVAASEVASPPQQLPERQPPLLVLDAAVPSRISPASYTPERTGLLSAFEHYLERRNEEALNSLRRYPAEDREIALATLPILANIDQGDSWSTIAPNQRQAILESLRGLQRRLARSAPLILQRVVFLDHVQTPYFGEVKPRGSSTFSSQDWVCIYFETMNLTDSQIEDNRYSAKINTAISLCSQDGGIIWSDTCVFQKTPSLSQRTDFCFTASLTLPAQAAPGAYQLVLAVTDLDTGRQARHALPLQIVQRSARKAKN